MIRALGPRALCLAVLCLAGSARAEVASASSERTLTVTLGDRVTLAYVVRLSREELAKLRREHDADRDGTLSRAETDHAVATLTSALGEDVRYASGRGILGEYGRLAAAHPIAREATGLEGPVAVPEGAAGAQLSWQFDLRLGRADDRLGIDDGVSAIAFERSEVLVRDGGGRRLLALGDDPGRTGPAPSLAWVDGGARERRHVHIVWSPPRDEGRGWMVMLVVVVGIFIAGATLWSVRSSTRQNEPDDDRDRRERDQHDQ